MYVLCFFFFFQAEDGIRDGRVTGVQTCALPICLIFLMHKKHPLTADDFEIGECAIKIEKLKERLKKERVVNFFKSPAELQAEVINSLSKLRQPNLTAFHYISDIP